MNTVQIILSDVHFGQQMHQLYAKNAFFHEKLEEEVLGTRNQKKRVNTQFGTLGVG